MRKVMLAALTGLGVSILAAPSIGRAAVFSIAPAIQAAGAASLDQASPVDEVRATTGSSSSRTRRRNRGQAHSSRSTRGSSTTR